MHKESYIKEKKSVAKWMRRLYDKGLTTSLGGNISRRLDEHHIAITASGTDKGRMKSRDIAIVTMDGQVVDCNSKISMETGMHLQIFKTRPDVTAVVHAHSPISSLFACMEHRININLLAEAYTIIGKAEVAEYALPGSDLLANNVAGVVKNCNVILMANHGVLAVGKDMLHAFDRIEVLENAAKMTILSTLLRDTKELSPAQLTELDKLFG